MSALIAWVAPLFSCIQNLYHVIDPDEEHFLSVEQIWDRAEDQRKLAMRPNIASLQLVNIPFSKEQHIDEEFLQGLISDSDKDLDFRLDTMLEEMAAPTRFVRAIMREEKILEVFATKWVAEQFRELRNHDATRTEAFENCFGQMQNLERLRKPFTHSRKDDVRDESWPHILHFFKRRRTTERPIFYTRPNDLFSLEEEHINQVVVCELIIEKEDEYYTLEGNRYHSFEKIVNGSHFRWESAISIETLLNETKECILIVPLGNTPMVATQLYTLLKQQENRNIKEIVLIYPEKAEKARAGANFLKMAFSGKNGLKPRNATIPELKDITDEVGCRKYQEILEKEIDRVRKEHANCDIILSLSGGRKAMTAMTIFTAQRKHIPYVYHTLINDPQLDKKVTTNTTIEALNSLNSNEERELCLDAYDQTKFTLFKVPVFPAGERS